MHAAGGVVWARGIPPGGFACQGHLSAWLQRDTHCPGWICECAQVQVCEPPVGIQEEAAPCTFGSLQRAVPLLPPYQVTATILSAQIPRPQVRAW